MKTMNDARQSPNDLEGAKRSIGHAKIELSCHWLTSPDSWNKDKFSEDIVLYLENTQGVNTYPNLVLVGLLANQIDLYVQCVRQSNTLGLIESYNKGATFGPNPYITMADKALNRIIQLMKELGLTPSHRVGSVRKMDAETLEIDELFADT